jgi:hypothetical protein
MARLALTEELPWLVKRVGCALTPDARGICVCDSEGQILGMVACDLWTPNACVAHVALASVFAGRALLAAFVRTVFGTWQKCVVTAAVLSNNERSLSMMHRLGGYESHRVSDGYAPGVDVIHFELREMSFASWLSSQRKAARNGST